MLSRNSKISTGLAGSAVPRLRQVALVAEDLVAAEKQLCLLLGSEVMFRDAGLAHFGLRNALWRCGDTFVEVVAPMQRTASHAPLPQKQPTNADKTNAAVRFLRRLGAPAGGYMTIVQVSDLAATERLMCDKLGLMSVHNGGMRLEGGVGPGFVPCSGRVVSNPGIGGTHWHPKDLGCIVETTQAEPRGSWLWAGAAWGRDWSAQLQSGSNGGGSSGGSSTSGFHGRTHHGAGDGDRGLRAVEIAVAPESVHAVATLWARSLECSAAAHPRGISVALADGSEVRIVAAASGGTGGVVAIELDAPRAELTGTSHQVLGVTWRFGSFISATSKL